MESGKHNTQVEKFKEAAREAECDMDEEKFDQALKKIAKAPPDSGSREANAPDAKKEPGK